MTPELLMKPRYIVIADWPGNNCFQPNEIFYEDDARVNNKPHWVNLSFKEMPHLFRKLSWWEHRSTEELPKYVKEIKGERIVEFSRFKNGYLNDTWFIDMFEPYDGEIDSYQHFGRAM